MRDWSRRAVRSEEETLAGAPRWSLIATFLSRSARSALPAWGERFPARTQRHTLEKKDFVLLQTDLKAPSKNPKLQTTSQPDCWTPRVAGLEGVASASFLALLAAEGFGPGGKARPPAPLWPPPARSSPSFPSLLSLSPSSVVLLAPCDTQEQYKCECVLKREKRTEMWWKEYWNLGTRVQKHSVSAVCNCYKATGVNFAWATYKLQHVPVKDVVIGEALSVEKIPEELPKIWVVWLVIKTQGTTQIQVSGELSWKTQDTKRSGF